MNSQNTGIIVLAAGASSRMGQSKQLLSIGGKSLLVHAAEVALATNAFEVIFVLGANADQHKKELVHLPVKMVMNDHWESGMGSSIKAGLCEMLRVRSDVGSALIMLVDQPKVNASHLSTLIQCLNNFSKTIVASFYGNAPGVPAIFSSIHFDEILSSDDVSGAKKIIAKHPDETLTIGFPEGSIDLDTPEDYERFLSGQ